jgi:hypothetical protein
MAQRPRLGELLVAAGVIDAAALEAALAKQQAQGGRIGKILLEAKALSEETLVRTLARQLSIPVAWLRDKQVKPEVLAHLPGHVAQKHRCLPVLIDQRGTATLLVAMEDPSDGAALDEIALAAGCPVRVVLAAPSELDDALARHYPGDAADDDEEPELLLEDPLAVKPEAAEPADPAFDLTAPGDSGLDLGSDLDLAPPSQNGAGLDLESNDALDLDAETDAAAGRFSDSLDAAIDDVRSADVRKQEADPEADTDTDLDIGPDLDAGPDLEADSHLEVDSDLDSGSDLDTGSDLELGADLEAGDASLGGELAAAGPSELPSAREPVLWPRDPELRAVVQLLIERGLLSSDEITRCLRAVRSPDSES